MVDNQIVPVEDPRQLEKVILHLVTNLPSPEAIDNPGSVSIDSDGAPSRRLAIIPPKKERIVSAIEKIYNIINALPKDRIVKSNSNDTHQTISVETAMVPQIDPSQINDDETDIRQRYSTGIPASPFARMETTAASNICKLPTFNNIYSRRQPEVNSSVSRLNLFNVMNPHDNLSSQATTPGSYTGTASISLTNVDPHDKPNVIVPNAEQSENIKYHVYIPSSSNVYKIDTQTELENRGQEHNIVTAGVKRSNDFKDEDISVKKKVAEVPKQDPLEQPLDQESPTLDTFFDEARK